MPKIMFKVLSADETTAHEKMMSLLRTHGFTVFNKAGRRYDFVATKDFTSHLTAIEERKQIEQEAGLDVVDIKLRQPETRLCS